MNFGSFIAAPVCKTQLSSFCRTNCRLCATKGRSEDKKPFCFNQRGKTLSTSPFVKFRSRILQSPRLRHYVPRSFAAMHFPSSPKENASEAIGDSNNTPLYREELSLEDEEERRTFVPENLPSWLRIRNPWIQLMVMLGLYIVHLLFLSKKGWDISKKFAPPDRGRFDAIGLDTISGLLVMIISFVIRRMAGVKLIPNLVEVPKPPWNVPTSTHDKLGATTLLLFLAYLASGYAAVFCEQLLLLLSFYGVPLTVASLRAWKVLLGHLIWVYMAVKILGNRLEPFFPPKGSWIKWRWRSNWLWWVTGGYYASGLLFNIADSFNQWILPSSLFNDESVVSKLVKPENNDLFAMAIGAIGPCLTAPVFEEVLYRGYLLPALATIMPIRFAIPLSSVLFAVHHLNIGSIIPLTVLGWAWALLYAHSRNLLVTILIHALWNSRVFLGSLLGL
ncbi:hypothetical protein GpartN1_g2469.t1 [Galdieria partita]|uniref:CAAX prenyl protease 2/Lysostaphin resistance protein A-like domain-containing protein n=1 Tax=Galdieria partita TaxID=83374 RepID=A0A9C7PTU7_9RHOD|nr:hypothetical protein GpartN1_g2469.t1 [Galdieria partita]